MKILLTSAAIGLTCAGTVIALNAKTIKNPKIGSAQEKSKTLDAKDERLKEQSSQIAKMTIERDIVMPLQQINNNAARHTYSRVLTLPQHYSVTQLESENEKEIKFALNVSNKLVFTKKPEKKDASGKGDNANIRKLFDLKYNLEEKQIYAWHEDQWKITSKHPYLKKIFSQPLNLTSFGHFKEPIKKINLNVISNNQLKLDVPVLDWRNKL